MNLYNIHTHTKYSHDSTADPEELCKEALRAGLTGFAVTDHCDCEYADDPAVFTNVLRSFDETQKLETQYAGQLIITKGVEIGEAIFDRGFAEKIRASREWDVILGSVHAVRLENWEMPFSTIDFSDKSDLFIARYLSVYFYDMEEMIRTEDFDVLSHLTVPLRYIVKKYHKNVNINDYLPAIRSILRLAIDHGKPLEVNTSSFDPSDSFFMPDEAICELYLDEGGRDFTIGSDAHVPGNCDYGLRQAAKMLASKGVTKLLYYKDRQPVLYSTI